MRTQRIEIPMPIKTAGNSREHHFARHRRIQKQREMVRLVLRCKLDEPLMPARITVCRVARGTLDPHDNLPMTLKGVVDGIADWLVIDDRDPRVRWVYDQAKPAKGTGKYQAVRITIESRDEEDEEICAN